MPPKEIIFLLLNNELFLSENDSECDLLDEVRSLEWCSDMGTATLSPGIGAAM